MRRRQVLAAVGALATAGCLGTGADAPTTTHMSSSTTTGRTTTESVRIASVETYELAIRMNHMGDDPSFNVPGVSSFETPESDVLETAIDGQYGSDEVPDWLAQLLADTAYVERDGTYYRLDATVPTYTLTAEQVDRSSVDGDIASSDTYDEAVTYDGLVRRGLIRRASRGGYEMPYVWPSLRSLVEEYAAVEVYGDIYEFSLSKSDPGPPYSVDATPVSADELVDGDVRALDAFPAEYRETIREAALHTGVHGTNADVSEDVLNRLDATRLVRVDDRYYNTYVERPGQFLVDVNATVESGLPEPRVTFAVRNEGDDPVDVLTGPPAPFGVLSYERADTDGTGTLWTDDYDDNEHVKVENGGVKMVHDIGIERAVAPGESWTRTYRLRNPETGRYVVDDSLSVSDGDASAEFPFRVEIVVTD